MESIEFTNNNNNSGCKKIRQIDNNSGKTALMLNNIVKWKNCDITDGRVMSEKSLFWKPSCHAFDVTICKCIMYFYIVRSKRRFELWN